MARSSIITLTTFGSISVATVMSLVWFSISSGEARLEPAVGVFGLLGGLAGILAERRAARQEKRRLTLATLTDELHRARMVLADERFSPSSETARRPRVYPRLPLSAVDAALVSGALTEPGDTNLLSKLHQWRDEVNGFNRRLELTEMRIFGVGAAHEMADFDRALYGYLEQVGRNLDNLQRHMAASTQIVRFSTHVRRWAEWFSHRGVPHARRRSAA
jgi:hypothetical protein